MRSRYFQTTALSRQLTRKCGSLSVIYPLSYLKGEYECWPVLVLCFSLVFHHLRRKSSKDKKKVVTGSREIIWITAFLNQDNTWRRYSMIFHSPKFLLSTRTRRGSPTRKLKHLGQKFMIFSFASHVIQTKYLNSSPPCLHIENDIETRWKGWMTWKSLWLH